MQWASACSWVDDRILCQYWADIFACRNVVRCLIKAHDIYPAAVLIAQQLLIRKSDKYPVLPGPAIYPATDLDGFRRYVKCLCIVTTNTLRVLLVPLQRHGGNQATDDLNPNK